MASLVIIGLASLLSGQVLTPTTELSAIPAVRMDYKTFYGQYAKPLLKARYPNSEGTKQVVQFLKDSLTHSGLKVNQQPFTDQGPDGTVYNFVNVWAETNPASENKVVLSCHHDSKLLFFKDGNEPFIGAIDSAIPCAILLYLAFLAGPEGEESTCSAAKTLEENDLSLVFIFFDGEEAFEEWTDTDSLYGSRYFAENIETERSGFLKSIKLFVLLDLIGEQDPSFKIFHHARDNLCYKRLQTIESSFKEKNLKSCNSKLQYHHAYRSGYFSSQVLAPNREVGDDHQPFMKKNVKNVLHLIPVPFPSVWHRMEDNEESLHHPTIENMLQIFSAFIQDLSCVG